MANEEHLKILKSGVEKWNKWWKKEKFIKPDLFRADLTGADLAGADLTGADLTGADLNRAYLNGADLFGANLFGAQLYQADLYQANLTGANLIDANLFKADLSGADLTEANLTGADLIDADLSGADLTEANLTGADLIEANLSGAKLTGADLTGANLIDADLSGAKLTGADLTDADLSGANLTGANLVDANLNNSQIGHTIFGLAELGTCIGLETVEVHSPCVIDFQTLKASKNIPKSFLLKIGLPELYIDYLPDFYSDSLTFFPSFLSHSWKNKEFARKLYEALIAKGVNVFFDEKKMKPGDDLYESISKGIQYYDKMILVCSKESLTESWWVDRELDRVLKKERELFKERGQRINLLIPITIDDYVFSWNGAKGEEVRRYVIGDFKQWQDETKFEKALNDLIHALNVERPDIKPPSFL